MASPLYATTDQLRTALDSTDAGTGTAAQLSDDQLTLALTAASDRISQYAGSVYDTASAPAGFTSLAIDLATFWATGRYLKHRDMGPQHPVWLAYTEAMKVLAAWRDGTMRPDPQAPGSVGSEPGIVINQIPAIFTGDDSNTRVSGDGILTADTPDEFSTRWLGTPPW